MNTAACKAQEVRTLVDMTQIRQFNMYQSKVSTNQMSIDISIKCPLQDLSDYKHLNVKFCDIDQVIFGKAKPKSASKHSLRVEKSMLVLDGDSPDKAIVDDNTQWMDDRLTIRGNDDFGPVENNANLDALELDEILADNPCTQRGKAKEVAPIHAVADSDDDIDPDAPWTWD